MLAPDLSHCSLMCPSKQYRLSYQLAFEGCDG